MSCKYCYAARVLARLVVASLTASLAVVAHARTYDFESPDALAAWTYVDGQHSKNGRSSVVNGIDGKGVRFAWYSVDDGADPFAYLKTPLGGTYDFSGPRVEVTVRMKREKRSTVAGFALFDGDELVAEYTRRLVTRGRWTGFGGRLNELVPRRSGTGDLASVDAIALVHHGPGTPERSGQGYVFHFDSLAIRNVDGLGDGASPGTPPSASTGSRPATPGTADDMPIAAVPLPDGPPEPRRDHPDVPELLRSDPLVDQDGFVYRIMVDKVNIGWKESVAEAIEAGDFRKYAELGFNVLCPRHHAKAREPEMAAAAERAGSLGMYHMHWVRASYRARAARDAPRFVHRDGVTYNHISPTHDRFWEMLEADIMPAVRLSTHHPILGAFLDFEKYDRIRDAEGNRLHFVGHWYPLSYDDHTWAAFFATHQEDAPEVRAADRADYLEENALVGAFHTYQVNYWRDRARALRTRIDAINPRFRFALYPSSFTLLVNEAVWPELATPRAPLIAAEHYTYGRGNPLKDTDLPHWRVPDDQALRLDHHYLNKMRKKYSHRSPHVILGGLNPAVLDGSDAQLSARKALLYARAFDGYWVFYEGVVRDSRHERAFDAWWRVANHAITQGEATVQFDLYQHAPELARSWLEEGDIPLP